MLRALLNHKGESQCKTEGDTVLTLEQIKQDLEEIRYYYSRQKWLKFTLNRVVSNQISEKVKKYNNAIHAASPNLYDMYVSLYVLNNSQEVVSFDLDLTRYSVTKLHKKLLLYFQGQISFKENKEE